MSPNMMMKDYPDMAYNPQAPQTPPRSRNVVDCSSWQDDDDDDIADGLVALLYKSHSKRPSKEDGGKLDRLFRRFMTMLLTLTLLVVAIVTHGSWGSPTVANHRAHETKRVQEVGWLDAIEEIREDLTEMSDTMREDHTKTDRVDISPLYDLIEKALNTVGVRGVFFELFLGIDRYIEWDDNCDEDIGHGVGCGAQDPWWLQHYVGIVTADLLVQNGQVLLDGTTGERIYDGVSFMKELHRLQEFTFTGQMSFHAEHGFMLHYIAATMPDVTTYPVELINSFCGDYLINNIRSKAAHKNIGSECYHGFGHAVFAVVSSRQLGHSKINARMQFRPNGGFALTNKAICEAYKLCEDAPANSWIPQKFCFGGFQHSAQLLNENINDPDKRDAYFDEHKKRCGVKFNDAYLEYKEEKDEKARKQEEEESEDN